MSYRCKDCGNSSTKKFPGGRCPACDSFNVTGRQSNRNKDDGPKHTSLFKKATAILLWSFFAWGIWFEYFRG